VSQEERSILREVTVSVILRKKGYINMCPIPNGFPIFGAQYFELSAQYFPSFPLYEQSQQPTDASHRFTCFRHWGMTVGEKENIARQIQNIAPQTSETVRNRTHVRINFFFRMTDTMTSQNIDLSSWDTLYKANTYIGTMNKPMFKIEHVSS
jgi:hypothetical protein